MTDPITIAADGVSARVTPSGAELVSLRREGKEYLWQADPAHWDRHAPILFPIVGVLRDGRATSACGPVELGRHGLARDYEHEVVERSASHVLMRLDADESTRGRYPYDFRLEMRYAIEGGALVQSYGVTNLGETTMPFTLGAHPAFNVPVPGDDADFSSYCLRFERAWDAWTPRLDEAGMVDDGTRTVLAQGSDELPLDHGMFERLLTVVLHDVPGRTVRLEGPAGHGVRLDFDGFDYLGVWTSDATAPFVAVEPWVGTATTYAEGDRLEEKRSTIFLEPGQHCTRTLRMRPY